MNAQNARVFESIEAQKKILPPEEWEKAGRPHMWCTVEKKGKYEAQVDTGYGGVRLLRNGREICRGKYYCGTSKIKVLDRDYYGAKKYIWT